MATRSIFVVCCVLLSIAISAPGAPLQSACKKPDGSEVHVPGGTFQMGSTEYYQEEGPVHSATVGGFSIDRFAVTNAQFAKFVKATGYVTDAEKAPKPEDYPEVPKNQLVAGGAVFTPPDGVRHAEDPMTWWSFVPGADWRHPSGPKSGIKGKDDYPVVQVSYNDAVAYAHWAGRELPTEAQLEYAARGGLDGKTYAWGDELNPDGKYMANTWQGEFPGQNLGSDGFPGIAPVGCFPPNGYGLYDMIGNVWEWSSTPYDPKAAPTPPSRLLRTIKGGSFLCAPNYCHRYRPAARQPQESGFSSMHLGFRTVKND
ncbi:MAG TPA: formylglycine-generating enzyme family protein [Alphaproteobacteria bacterium]|nr:formylglycine-generating enzyme family protein [Alphaproteobacteria bacterium]